jgi:uncharacterized protein YndB with AHSA1/START domain
MARSSSATAEQLALVLDIDRVFDAPRELVWRLWRDPEHMIRWHGPEGYALLECEIDFRVGGKWRRCMSNGPGHQHWIHGEYLEIDEPGRLSFTYINDADGFETVVTMDFLEVGGGRTRMVFEQTPFLNREERDGHGWGWNSGFNCFADYLARLVGTGGSPQGLPRSEQLAAGTLGGR